MHRGKILVTGGAGYIGAHTAVALSNAGYEPVIADDLSRSTETLILGAEKILEKKLPFFRVDCTNESAFRKIFEQHRDITSVIHFAAFKSVSESVAKPALYYQNNVGSLLTLLGLLNEFHVNSIVFSSSCTVYGQPAVIPVTEEAPFAKAESPYGTTKQVCELVLQDEVKANSDLKAISLRYFNPVGAHPSGLIGELPIGVPSNLVPFMTQSAIGKRGKLTVFGNDYDTPDGSCLRDYIHVIDIAEAHVRAVDKIESLPSRYEAINLGTGVPVSVLELVRTFIKVSGVKLDYAIGQRRPGDIEKIYADVRKSHSMLNWNARFSLEEALRDAWNWEQQLAHASH